MTISVFVICLILVVPTFQLNESQYSWENLASFPEDVGQKEQEKEGRPGPTYSGRCHDKDPVLLIYITFKK